MLDRKTDMKVEAATLAAECRQLRLEGRKALRKARKVKDKSKEQGSKVTETKVALTYSKYRNIYVERMLARKEARYHHLARMLLKGQDYHNVEPITYERVDPVELYERVWQWDPAVSYELVEEWLQWNI